MLIAGGLGKAPYFFACAALVAAGIGKPLVLAFGLGDLAMAVLFAWAVLARSRPPLARKRSGLMLRMIAAAGW